MSNKSDIIKDFVLMGLWELEKIRYFYFVLSVVIYMTIIFFSSTIVCIVLTERSLHEPMYVLICNLVLNGIFESSSIFPKLISDLITTTGTIDRGSCLTQMYFLATFIYYEVFIYAIMAYNRYLAVCEPLRYITLMNIKKTVKLSIGSFAFISIAILVAILLSARLPLCGNGIKSIFCDNISYFMLSCVDSSLNNLYSTVSNAIVLTFTLFIIFYSYIRILAVCWTVSRNAHKKAMHTVLTHLINFSIYLVGLLFLLVRHKLARGDLPVFVHILLSINVIVFPPLLNPFIYGVRTKALREKIWYFWKQKIFLGYFDVQDLAKKCSQ